MSTAKDSPAPAMENVHAALSASTDTPTPQPGGLVDARTDTPSATPDETHGEALDAAWRDEILALLERGLRPREAAACAGVTLAAIKADLARDASFAKRFHRARLSVKLKHLDNIHDIREGNGWRVSAWYLASAYPDEFARPGGARPGARRARASSSLEAQRRAMRAFPRGDERDAPAEPPAASSAASTPAPDREADEPPPRIVVYQDEALDAPAVPPPPGMPAPARIDGRTVPPPNCVVVGESIRPDGATPGVETIFADYDQAMYDLLAFDHSAETVAALQRHGVRRCGAYFEHKGPGQRTVGRREVLRRFGTLDVRRYVWTGAAHEQVFPLPPEDAEDEHPP